MLEGGYYYLLFAHVIRHDCQHDNELSNLHIKLAARSLWTNRQGYDGCQHRKILIFGIDVFRWPSENAEITLSFMCDTSSICIIHKATMVRTYLPRYLQLADFLFDVHIMV